MNLESFIESLSKSEAPEGLTVPLEALWSDARGEWEEAHELVQEEGGREAARVHAYLHRKEGDESNARYWYSRARRTFPDCSLKEEWNQIVTEMLDLL